MASAGPITPANWADFDAVLFQIRRNTVDRLKRIIRYINERLFLYIKSSGLKASLIDGIEQALQNTRIHNNLRDYGIVRYAILHPDTLFGSSYSYPASTSSSAPSSTPAAAAATSANRTYSFGPGADRYRWSGAGSSTLGAPQPTSAASAAALARSSYPTPAPSALSGSSRPPSAFPPASSTPSYTAASAPKPANKEKPIDFRPNPFLTFKCALSSVVACPRTQTGERRSVTASFNLTPEQRQLLVAARESDKSPQYQVRVYCCSETYYTLPISSYYSTQPSQPLGPAPVEFPMQSEARINNCAVAANLRGVKKKEGTVMPPNVGNTKNNLGALALDLSPSGRNTVDLVYVNTEKRFFVVVCLVEYHPAAELLKQVKDAPPKSKESVIADVIEANKDEDIVATSAALSLRCPLSFMRLKEPIRSKSCSHIQCFEASTWFAMNEQTPTWNCPQCNKALKIVDLFIDDFTRNIIATVPEKYDSVIVEPDATWYTEDNKYGTSSRVGQAVERSQSEVKREASPESSSKQEGGSGSRSIQILDSDDDDNNLGGPPLRSVASSSSSSRPMNGRTSPRRPPPPRGAVIDLTLSDDEDEEPTPASTSAAPRTETPTSATTTATAAAAPQSRSGVQPSQLAEPWASRDSSAAAQEDFIGQKRARDEGEVSDAGAPPGSRPRLSDDFLW